MGWGGRGGGKGAGAAGQAGARGVRRAGAARGRGGLRGQDLEGLGIPSLQEYKEAYCRRVGRETIENWNFYLAYNMFRSAGIAQGIAGRVRDGTAASAYAEEVGAAVPRTAEAAWAWAQRV